jgi:hypothetical protein
LVAAYRWNQERNMTTTDQATWQATWEAYAQAWKLTTKEEKARALAESTSTTCSYRDPLAETHGHQALVDYMLQFHTQVPGGHFVTTYFQAHHERSVAKWNMVDANNTVIGEGVSHGEYGADGKLVAMTGFFEVPPSAA